MQKEKQTKQNKQTNKTNKRKTEQKRIQIDTLHKQISIN